MRMSLGVLVAAEYLRYVVVHISGFGLLLGWVSWCSNTAQVIWRIVSHRTSIGINVSWTADMKQSCHKTSILQG